MLFPAKKKYTLLDCTRIVYSTVPGFALLRLLFAVIDGLLPSAIVLASANFIDKALAVATGGLSRSDVLPALAIFAGVMALNWMIGVIEMLANARMDQRFSCKIWKGYIDFMQPLAYRYIEDSDSANMAERFRKQITNVIRGGYYQILDVVRILINIVTVAALIAATVWWSPIVLVGMIALLAWISVKSGKATNEFEHKTEGLWRHTWAISQDLTQRDSVEERMMFDYSDDLDRFWQKKMGEGIRKSARLQMGWRGVRTIGNVITLCAGGAMIAPLVGPTVSGALSIGMFISLSGAAFNLVDLSWNFAWLAEDYAWRKDFLKDIAKMSMWERDLEAELPPSEDAEEFESLEFKNVTFTYPGTERQILNGLSFKLEKGKHYAIVGSNGAGKTTIAKLITGLYGEYEGEILLNGRELRSWPMSERKAIFACLFQDFARYEISLRKNIELGALPNTDEVDIDRAIRLSGLEDTVAELPKGVETPLGKIDEGGQELSGGQWQRVAMARTVSGRRQFYILDEPTAALDPMAESRMYEDFGEIAKGKTTVFITHRLGSVHLADEIIVIENGVTAEQGSFEELSSGEGVFARMYASQRSWYV
ncbi:MAG: ABC transporter ATP-binding protein [Clostridia bacterium]|nr:ABC transporter ATP-binding protein [Clostridia bacterium]